MRYVLVDDSIPYDAYTPMRRAMGGPEKAVASLATELQLRGHDVHVTNRTAYAHMADGAYYAPFDDSMTPKSADVLIAVRKPALLGTVRNVRHRMLWVSGATEYLQAPANTPLWGSFAPTLLFVSHTQARTYTGKLKSLVVTPGVRGVYFDTSQTAAQDETLDLPPPRVVAPHAVVTTHPLHGLSWLLDLWQSDIHPRLPDARLAVYSAVLSKGLRDEAIPEDVLPVLQKIKEAAARNVVVVEPLNDDGMAGVYRAARVHLYPGHAQDFACWTLAESQAAGLPAVARALGGVDERIVNGQSGFIVPDASAFANVAVEILGNDAVRKSMSDGAGDVTRRRPWSDAAAEIDAHCTALLG